MSKQCRECRTMMNAEAPYCDACGCAFPAPKDAPFAWKAVIGMLAIFALGVVLMLLRSYSV